MPTTLSPELLDRLALDYASHPKNRVMGNAVAKNGLNDVALSQRALRDMQYTFSIELETGKITAQNSSGRCWLFAGLNTFRYRIMKKLNLETFELSQNHLMFWDKLEKANYFLENILRTLDEPTEGRLIHWLLGGPLSDGGQWDMFVNLVQKYGVVPKYVMPETHHSGNTRVMNRILTVKLREDAARLRQAHRQGTPEGDLRAKKQAMLAQVYRILCHALGEPPKQFDFECRGKDQKFHQDLGLTPQAFAKKYVDMDPADYVSVINAPTADKPYGKTYTVNFLGNVEGGRDILYLNTESHVLKELALAQLQDGEPVWFGCDVGKMMDRDSGIMDLHLYDYEGVLDVAFGLDKGERLDYRESLMTHAMVFLGVNLVDGQPTRWKVENSWSEKAGKEGYFIMSDNWFDEYLYQVVIHKKHLPAELQDALEEPPIELEPWDPMGSLAC
jgi:bleomycin hydrolase